MCLKTWENKCSLLPKGASRMSLLHCCQPPVLPLATMETGAVMFVALCFGFSCDTKLLA